MSQSIGWRNAAALCFILYPVTAQASDNHFSFETRAYVSSGFDDGDINQAELVVEPKWERNWTSNISSVVSGRLRVDVADDLTPDRPDTSGYSSMNGVLELGDVGMFELRDAYVDVSFGNVFARLGNQQIVWGELEGFHLLDVVNPQTFREFWTASFEFPLTSGKYGDWDAQLIWVPDPTVSEIPVPGAVFDFQSPRFLFGASPSDITQGSIVTDAPDILINDSAYGGRITGLLKGWDLSLVAYSGLDTEPVGEIDIIDNQPTVLRTFQRRTVLGGSAATTFGRFTGRLEIAAQPSRSFTTNDGLGNIGSSEADQIGIAAAVDATVPGDIFLSVQGIYDRLNNVPDNIVRPQDDVLTSVYAERRFLRDDLKLSLRWLGSDGGSDGLFNPKVNYAISDSTSASFGVYIFYGDEQ